VTEVGACPTRATIGVYPTPLQHVPGYPRLRVKREDLSGFGFGGSKIRLLDQVVSAGRRRGASALVTGGRRDSNWVPLAMMAAHREGWDGYAVFDPTPSGSRESSAVRLTRRLGASVSFAAEPGADAVKAGIACVRERLEADGQLVAQVPRGGRDAEATRGYTRIVEEILGQRPIDEVADLDLDLDLDLIVPVGGGGLGVGLALGLVQQGHRGRVVGVAVTSSAEVAQAKVAALCEEVAAAAGGLDGPTLAGRVTVVPVTQPTDAGARALSRTAGQLGLLLDPVFGRPAWSTAFAAGLATSSTAEVVLVASGGLPMYLEEVGES